MLYKEITKSKLLFYLLILLLPTQLGYHFWPDFTSVLGLRIDYLSPTIYLTDLIVLVIVVANFSSRLSRNKLRYYLVIFCFLLVNCLLAQNRGAAFYKLVKIIEFTLLGVYVARSRDGLRLTSYVLPWVLIYSSLIAIAQFFKQASLNGVFWWLGERTFNSLTPGIAQAEIFGRQVLRPYGTFSHPNSLAGFLLVSLIVVANFSSRFSFFFFFLTLLTIFLSFSRAVWGIGLLVITSWWMFKKKQRFIRRLLLFFFIVSLFYCFIVLLDFGSLSFQRRMVLNRAAWEMVRSSPLFGVGLNNFIPRLPEFWRSVEAIRFLQPVHNIYLLVGAELGVFGGIGVIGGIGKTILKVYKEKRWPVFWALMAIFLLGLFDHYWLTLQQNQLLLAIILGLAWKQEKT